MGIILFCLINYVFEELWILFLVEFEDVDLLLVVQVENWIGKSTTNTTRT